MLVDRDARVAPGDIVVALVGDEATIKTLRKQGRRVVLEAANPKLHRHSARPGPPGEFRILGRVYEVRRTL